MSNKTNKTAASAQDTVYNSEFLQSHAQAAANTVQNHPATQSVKDSLSNGSGCTDDTAVSLPTSPIYSPLTLLDLGPVADKAKDIHAKTTSDFQNLADTRTTPSQPAATGQPLTHYHSLFYSLLSWENPYATGVSFLAVISFIFACRYLPALKFLFGTLYWTLGAIVLVEVAGKLVVSQGIASSFRPKRYYTIPREALEASLEDVEQLLNFFVIEFQRVLFAENVTHTIAACAAAFFSYYLIKIVPFWGLCLIGTSVAYLGPLIYTSNRELIDSHLANAQDVVNSQTSQITDLASQHTKAASQTVKQYAGDYTAKAQEYIGTSSKRQTAGLTNNSKPASEGPKTTSASAPKLSDSDFPHAPKQEIGSIPGATSHQEQYEKSQFGGQAVPAS